MKFEPINSNISPYQLPCNKHGDSTLTNTSPPSTSFYRRQLPEQLVDLTSPEGKQRFASALAQGNAEAFFPLISQLQTQSHPAFCGLTTLSTVLNALAVDPKRVWAHPWRWFAESLLGCCMDVNDVKETGINLDQLACTAQCQGCAVVIHREMKPDDARKLIRQSVRGTGSDQFEFVIASYDRKSLRQTGSGHFSPIAAFDDDSDSVLVLDVARFKVSIMHLLKRILIVVI